MPGRRSLDDDQFDRPAGPVVVENPDGQPAGAPGQRIEICAAFEQQRAIGIIVVAVNDVARAETCAISLRIALPQQRGFVLLRQRKLGIDTGMDVDAMGIDMHQPQLVEPCDVGFRHRGRLAAIGRERRVAAFFHPRSPLRRIA
jgi:hypothetical protein